MATTVTSAGPELSIYLRVTFWFSMLAFGRFEGTVKLAFVERAGTRDRDLSSSQAVIVTASQMRKERPRSSR